MNKCYCNDPTCGNNHDIEEINDAEDIAGELEYERIKSEDDRDNQQSDECRHNGTDQ